MLIRVEESGTVNALQALIEEVAADARVKGLLILACDANGYTPESVDALLQNASLPLFGGIFPQIIHGRSKLAKGVIVAGLTTDIRVNTIANLGAPSNDFEEIVNGLVPQAQDAKTIFVFVDGYAKRISDLIDSLHNVLGLGYNYIGGGAGSIDPTALDLALKPCLFTNHGLLKDSALVVLADIRSGIGVGHGWSQLCGPFRVTASDKNVIRELDWRPAFEVYKEAVERYSPKPITAANFFDISKSYPFGIVKLGSEMIVRDPFAVDEDNCLIVAAEVPVESFVYILSGDRDTLVQAAHKASDAACANFGGDGNGRAILLIDCISRVLFLEDEFIREIDAVHVPDAALIGLLSLGEIANSGNDYMELLNKTAVVGVLEG